jgi:RNase P subunit RPR2
MLLRCFVEKLPNIFDQCLIVHIYWECKDAVDSVVEFDHSSLTVRFRIVDPLLRSSIIVDSRSHQQQQQQHDDDDEIDAELRLEFSPLDAENCIDVPQCKVLLVRESLLTVSIATTRNAQLSAPVLLGGNEPIDPSTIRRLHCAQCRSLLVNGDQFERILPLPSAGWLEMSELWNCKCSHATPSDNDISRSTSSSSSSSNSTSSMTTASFSSFNHAIHNSNCNHSLFSFRNMNTTGCTILNSNNSASTTTVTNATTMNPTSTTTNNSNNNASNSFKTINLRTEIKAQQNLCLVGDASLLVHSSCVLTSAIQFRALTVLRGSLLSSSSSSSSSLANNNNSLLAMTCRQCDFVVGTILDATNADSAAVEHRLYAASEVNLFPRSLSTLSETQLFK